MPNTICLTTWVMVISLFLCRPAHAQSPSLRTLASFLGVGGYFFTSGSADRAVGSPKFYGNAAFFVRPAHVGSFLLSGGAQFISTSDHFLPFSGGNSVDWYGLAARLSTPRKMNRVNGVVTSGLYLGRIRSERLGFDVARFAPSVYFGAEYPFARYFTLSAGYRVSQEVHGVNLDGFSVALKFF